VVLVQLVLTQRPVVCSIIVTTKTMRAFKWDVSIVEHTELDLRYSSAHLVHPDIAVSALDHVDAARLVTYTRKLNRIEVEDAGPLHAVASCTSSSIITTNL